MAHNNNNVAVRATRDRNYANCRRLIVYQCSNGRSTAIFPEMERLPEQHGVVLQTPEEREELHGRDTCLRRTNV